MTASWEPTSRASVQGRSSSLRNILGFEAWGEREERAGGQAGRELTMGVKWCQGKEKKQAKSAVAEGRTQMYGHAGCSHQQPCHLSLPAQVSVSPTPPQPTATISSWFLPPVQRSLWRTSLPIQRGRETHLGSICLLPNRGGSKESRGSRDVRHHPKLEMSQRPDKGSNQHSWDQLEQKWARMTKPPAEGN